MRDLLTRKGENGAPSIKESIALPSYSFDYGGEYSAADGGYPYSGRPPVSEQPPFTTTTVTSFVSLYHAYRKTMKGKAENTAALRYTIDHISNLFDLSRRLTGRLYEMARYNSFKVYEPKERDVMSISFEDKIVLHSLCDFILEPLLNKGFIIDNYANQKGKGLHFGLKRLKHSMRSYYLANKAEKEAACRAAGERMPRIKDYDYNDGWIIKGDIKKFFYSIDHNLLRAMLIRKLVTLENKADAAFAFWLCEKIINSTINPGIPIGNQTSQPFALLFLDGFDHYVKQTLKIKYYGRYMDDFFIIVKTRDAARKVLAKTYEYITGLQLALNEKTNIFPLSQGLDYLGFHTYLTQTGRVIRKLRRKSKTNMKRKIKKFRRLVNAGKMELEKVKQSYTSWLGHIKHGNTYRLKAAMDKYFYSEFPELKIKTINKEKRNVSTSRQSAY
jgi:hypothetical protein